ncbi:MAG: SagB/ThcOx family dehydrogenase [Proteobacteria bacterium]|nr:SagB/ThcOx family dehydrogenase [Pseudomonadota bacterium]
MKALDYHEATKHSWARIRAEPHYLDFENMPSPFKIYSDLDRRPLPKRRSGTNMPALSAVADPGAPAVGERVPSLEDLAQLLSAVGITKRRLYPGGEVLYRGASCTGALYHVEVYIVCGDLEGLPAGVHQFQPDDFSLCTLRRGDHRQGLLEASGAHPAVAEAPAVLVLTSTWWRNAWKYRARTYRHAWWDSGCMLANLLASAAALDLPASVVLGYADNPVNRLLDVDPQKEGSLALVPLGRGGPAPATPAPAAKPLGLRTEPLSEHEVEYSEIPAAYAASSLGSGTQAATWRGGLQRGRRPAPTGRLFPLEPAVDGLPTDPVEAVTGRRGSTRRFARKTISFSQLSTILDRTTRGIPADFLDPPGARLCDVYLIIHAVERLPSGTYIYRPAQGALELLREGDFRREAGMLGLGQELPADASVNLYYLTDLHSVIDRFGDRGYRAAQLEGGILGGKVYLAAYALGCGATGLTFFDDDVTDFFSPDAAGKSVMFLMAVGRPGRRSNLAR